MRPRTTRPRPSPARPSRRPASSTCAWPTPRSNGSWRGSSPSPPAGAGSRRRIPGVNVEFVSANPTGPLHVGNARGAFVGDLLSRVLEAGGQRVTREYYFNDSGGQIRNLGASVAALRRGDPVPEDGYQGEYVARPRRGPSPTTSGRPRRRRAPTADGIVGHWAAGRVREGIEESLTALGVRFDVWTSEARLHDEGWVARGGRAPPRARPRLRVRTARSGSARPTFGDDKDRVIFRSNGEPTYFAADIGYVTEKFSRGFDHLIYIWGADHHGTVARVRNAAEAMGYDARRRRDQALLAGSASCATARRSRCPSAPASSSPSTTCWPRWGSTPPAGSSRHERPPPASTSTSSWRRSSRTRTPSTTSSTPTPGSPRSCARRRMPG